MSQYTFSRVPRIETRRSQFDRSSTVKTTFDSGYLVPFFVDEALPGDTFNLSTTGFSRLSTPIYPVMDNMYLDTFYFAVPFRLVWDNFQKFMGEQRNPGDSTDYLMPVCNAPVGGWSEHSLFDYFGLPTGVENINANACFFRAYNLIWNEWFRDQNLQDSVDVPVDDTDDDSSIYNLLRRGKRHDYFTSCLPWPQKGQEVTLSLAGRADIASDASSGNNIKVLDNSYYGGGKFSHLTADTSYVGMASSKSTSESGVLYADMTDVTSITINQLREAEQIQRLLERDARGGTRYIEIIENHFGVKSPDARLQRPEYLGGNSTPLNITPIAQTSESNKTVQGNLAAMGTALFERSGFVKSFTEHTIVIGLVSVRADLTYQNGINRMFSRSDKYDYYWPDLANLGEQAVLNKEIYAQGTDDDEMTFGYQERYSEYRYRPSTIHGRFRSSSNVSLDSWHLSQHFDDLPVLSDDFIQDRPPVDRVVAVTTEPQFIADFRHKLVCARPMPLYSIPGIGGSL